MDNIWIREIAYDLTNRIGIANVGEKLVAQALAFTGALHQSGNVNKLNCRWHDPAGMNDICKLLQPLVRNVHYADIGIDRCKRIICRKATLACQRREQCRLPNIWKANYTYRK